jgi:hypothetical protein
VQSACECGNEPTDITKCSITTEWLTTDGLTSNAQLQRVSQLGT